MSTPAAATTKGANNGTKEACKEKGFIDLHCVVIPYTEVSTYVLVS